MKLLKIFSVLIILSLTLGSCEKLLEPEADNHFTADRLVQDPTFATGLLMEAYAKIPTSSLSFNDVATDDAVTNDNTDNFLKIATGQWSSMFNPLDQWSRSISAIISINKFLSIMDSVPPWKWSDLQLDSLYRRRFKGESYALRGLFKYHLLVTVGGKGTNGELLGIPIINEPFETSADFNSPRASFTESVNSIYADLDKALEYLIMDDYVDITAAQLPAGLKNVKVSNYNTVFGKISNQLISGRIVKALKARVALLAASPAFSADDPLLWGKAADYAAAVITSGGALKALDVNGYKFYDGTLIDKIDLSKNIDQAEILWRSVINSHNSRESSNFPPSLFGKGDINPTQNLVDAFPMKNGYPISNALSNYVPSTPYLNRDPRLALYIAYNGCTMKGTTIKTGVGGGINAIDSIYLSTRTGYYLRKLLREDVNMDPTATTTKKHYEVHMRYTEMYLIYAEAANEAWGPDGMGTNGFSARQVIAAIRKRAGITTPDPYLASITTKDGMRTLIRNERRLELCFEGFRFWDLRRWKSDLTEPAKGVYINGATFTYKDIESRLFNNDYMYYGPVPQSEVLKYNAIIQNQGW